MVPTEVVLRDGAASHQPVADAPPPDDDLAQVVLRDLLAGVLTSLVASGLTLALLASLEREGPLLGQPVAALAFAIGVGLGGGLAFAAAEAACDLVGRTRRRLPAWRATGLAVAVLQTLAAALALGLVSPLAPLGGAFELLLVKTGSSAEAWSLVTEALGTRPRAGPGLPLVPLALAVGLPLLAARRWRFTTLGQAAAASAAASLALAASAVWEIAALTGAPTIVLAAPLLLAALVAPTALALADRTVRRVRRRPAPPASPARLGRRLVAALALAAALGLPTATLLPLPGERPDRLHLRLAAATTTDLRRLEGILEQLSWFLPSGPGGWGFVPLGARGAAPVQAPLTGFAPDDVLCELEVWLPPEDFDASRRPVLTRAAALGLPSAMVEEGQRLVGVGRAAEGRALLLGAARAGGASGVVPLEDAGPSAPERAELEALLVEGMRTGRPGWIEHATTWAARARTRPARTALLRLLIARADLGDVRGVTALEALWLANPPERPALEACLTRVAAGAAPGDPALVPWRAVEALARLARSSAATPGVLEAAFAAARRHAAVETAEALALGEERLDPSLRTARRTLLELLVARPGLRRAEDDGRLPTVEVEVPCLVHRDWRGYSIGSPAAATPDPAPIGSALAALEPFPQGAGPGRAGLLAFAAGDPARTLEEAHASLARNPGDVDAHRALARLDLARAVGAWRGTGAGRAALCRAEAHLWRVLGNDPANVGALVERALVVAARETPERPSRAVEVGAWLVLATQLESPAYCAPAWQALRGLLSGAPRPMDVDRVRALILRAWWDWAWANQTSRRAASARTFSAVERATRVAPRKKSP